MFRVALTIALLFCGAAPSFAVERPNIIYIMLDDAGYGDFKMFGNDVVKTPNFYRMCKEGTWFTQHYAGSSVCAPTRCVLMTGLHTGHCRRRDNTATAHLEDFQGRPLVFLEPEDLTIAETLKQAGYVAGGIGKWGLGNPDSTGQPDRQGFDHWFGYLDQVHAHDHYTDWLWDDGRRREIPENQGNRRGVYAHDLFEQRTFDFIRQYRDRRFFLYLAYTLPHGKYDIPQDDPAMDEYRDKPWTQQVKNYAAMITRADRTVGGILDLLQELKIDDNTIVFYTTDNGPNTPFVKAIHSNGGLRGTKRQLYEGGIRVPLVVRWPGHVTARKSSGFLTSMVDFFPTACELAGVDPPENLDGQSILPTLLSRAQPQPPYLYWEIHHPFQQAVRTRNWKAIRFGTEEPIQLYQIWDDRTEANDVAAEHPDVVKKIEAIMSDSRTESRYWPAVMHRVRNRKK